MTTTTTTAGDIARHSNWSAVGIGASMRYRVTLPRHGTCRDTTSLAEALRHARGEVRDGWTATKVIRLADGATLYQVPEGATRLRKLQRS